jgi:4-amino-4-deoxy-L-arabinose transferase-like glycosyltransferase
MTRRTAGLVVASTLALKIALLAFVSSRRPDAFVYVDSREYLGAARALVTLAVYAPDITRRDEPEILRAPGYPLIAAASLAVFGERTWPLSAIGALVSAMTALVVLFRFSPPLSERAAAWAATLFSIDPGSFVRSLDILSETVFTFLMILALSQFIRLVSSANPRSALLAGLTLAAATLVRPIAQYLAPLAVLALAGALVAAHVPRRRLAAACAAFAAPILVLVGGWILRNRNVAGFSGLVPVAGHQLLHRRAAAVLAAAERITLTEAQERLGMREAFLRFRGPSAEQELFGSRRYAEEFPETARESLVSLDRKWRLKAWEIFRAHPVLTARMLASGAAMLLFSPPPLAALARFGAYEPGPVMTRLWEDQELVPLASHLAREHPAVFLAVAASILWLVFLWGAAAAGLRAAPKVVGVAPTAILGVTLAYFVILSAGTDALDDRFRLPLVPPACLLAGIVLAARRAAGTPGA